MVAIIILCFCDAVYEYAGSCETRNEIMEMANDTVYLHDIDGLFFKFDCLYFVVINKKEKH